MGLFSRSGPDDNQNNDDFKDIELPNSKDLNEPVFSAPEPSINLPKSRPSLKAGYGIEDAIELMRGLPRDNNEVVVTVVKKTLESTNISVQDIIDDADAKETRIRENHKKLEEEIKQFQSQIAQRNQQITELLDDLKVTTDVRERMQLALQLDKSKQSTSDPKPAAVATNKTAVTPNATTTTKPGSQTAGNTSKATFSSQPLSSTAKSTAK